MARGKRSRAQIFFGGLWLCFFPPFTKIGVLRRVHDRVSESQQKVISGWVMCRKINGKPPGGGRRPDWADDGYFSCSLLNWDVLLGASVAAPEGAEEKIAAFFTISPPMKAGSIWA